MNECMNECTQACITRWLEGALRENADHHSMHPAPWPLRSVSGVLGAKPLVPGSFCAVVEGTSQLHQEVLLFSTFSEDTQILLVPMAQLSDLQGGAEMEMASPWFPPAAAAAERTHSRRSATTRFWVLSLVTSSLSRDIGDLAVGSDSIQ